MLVNLQAFHPLLDPNTMISQKLISKQLEIFALDLESSKFYSTFLVPQCDDVTENNYQRSYSSIYFNNDSYLSSLLQSLLPI